MFSGAAGSLSSRARAGGSARTRLLAIGGAPASVRRRDDVRARAEAHR